MNARCPGTDTRYWTAKDIFEVACIHCGAQVEFFKDDLRRACPHCGGWNVNPALDLACAAWCAHGEACLAQVGVQADACPEMKRKEA